MGHHQRTPQENHKNIIKRTPTKSCILATKIQWHFLTKLAVVRYQITTNSSINDEILDIADQIKSIRSSDNSIADTEALEAIAMSLVSEYKLKTNNDPSKDLELGRSLIRKCLSFNNTYKDCLRIDIQLMYLQFISNSRGAGKPASQLRAILDALRSQLHDGESDHNLLVLCAEIGAEIEPRTAQERCSNWRAALGWGCLV